MSGNLGHHFTIYSVIMVLALSGCGETQFGSERSQAENEALKASVFSDDAGGSINQPGGSGGSISQPGGSGGSINQPRKPDVAGTNPNCPAGLQHTPSLDALKQAIQTRAPAADQATSGYEANNCAAGLSRFTARAVDSAGNTKAAKQIDGKAFAGVYCSHSSGAAVELHMQMFKMNGLRSNGVSETYLCKSGTDPNKCAPSSADFIAGFKWGAASETLRVDSFGQSIDPDDLVQEIILSSGRYSDFNECQDVALYSPIVIEKFPGKGATLLDPMSTRTYFDLTGEGRRERISCVADGAFLALPNANGKVENINQLFGDNTVGPDGNKSLDGYKALGKHDPYGTGIIIPQNPVFRQLRLWEDRNCNGQSEPEELLPLEEWDITAIRWANAVPMFDRDKFGNETRLRNTVLRRNARPLKSFDIWFKSYGHD